MIAMICNQNEKYLLKYISSQTSLQNKNSELLEVLYKFGIKLKFKNDMYWSFPMIVHGTIGNARQH